MLCQQPYTLLYFLGFTDELKQKRNMIHFRKSLQCWVENVLETKIKVRGMKSTQDSWTDPGSWMKDPKIEGMDGSEN